MLQLGYKGTIEAYSEDPSYYVTPHKISFCDWTATDSGGKLVPPHVLLRKGEKTTPCDLSEEIIKTFESLKLTPQIMG